MKDDRSSGFPWTRLWVYVGATLFLAALLVSAIVDPELRVLHCFQALIYLAVIVMNVSPRFVSAKKESHQPRLRVVAFTTSRILPPPWDLN